jgi:hypothetical protein
MAEKAFDPLTDLGPKISPPQIVEIWPMVKEKNDAREGEF